MAVKIRFARKGRKNRAQYDLVVADSRSPRDGKFIEKIGTYNPNVKPFSFLVNEERTINWLMKGAECTDTARSLLSSKGLLLKHHLKIGVAKGSITQEDATHKFALWQDSKKKSDSPSLA
jgi:small subunit ribosomal protein S16